jgi:hypothetical protein
MKAAAKAGIRENTSSLFGVAKPAVCRQHRQRNAILSRNNIRRRRKLLVMAESFMAKKRRRPAFSLKESAVIDIWRKEMAARRRKCINE